MYICIQSTESDSLKLLLNLCVDKPDIQEKQTFDTKNVQTGSAGRAASYRGTLLPGTMDGINISGSSLFRRFSLGWNGIYTG